MPELVADEIASLLDEGHRHLEEPRLASGGVAVPFGEDRRLERELLADVEVRGGEIPEEVADDLPRVARVAHVVQQVERALTDGDVGVVKPRHNLRLIRLDRVERVRPDHRREVIEPEVHDVGLVELDESPEGGDGLGEEGLVRDVEHRRQLDRFEEHRVQRVVLVDVLHHVRVLQDLVDDVHLSAKVVWILGGGEVLQHAHALHLQPR